MDALLGWFKEQDIHLVDLHASTFGEPIYRSYGFTDPASKAMSLRL